MSDYASIKSLHASASPFTAPIPPTLLPYIALISLAAFFAFSFLFTTIPRTKNPLPELGTGLIASLLAGGGVVALFCAVGVHV